jgi:hypothetical protein
MQSFVGCPFDRQLRQRFFSSAIFKRASEVIEANSGHPRM